MEGNRFSLVDYMQGIEEAWPEGDIEEMIVCGERLSAGYPPSAVGVDSPVFVVRVSYV